MNVNVNFLWIDSIWYKKREKKSFNTAANRG
jgi:hypothetical protein